MAKLDDFLPDKYRGASAGAWKEFVRPDGCYVVANNADFVCEINGLGDFADANETLILDAKRNAALAALVPGLVEDLQWARKRIEALSTVSPGDHHWKHDCDYSLPRIDRRTAQAAEVMAAVEAS